MSILSSQADPPTLKNLDFAWAGARFVKNQGLRRKDAFEDVLGLSWAPLEGLLAALGALLTAIDDPSWRKLGSKMPSEAI